MDRLPYLWSPTRGYPREAKLSYRVLIPGEESLVRVHLYTGTEL